MRSHPKNRQHRRFRRGWLAVLAVLTALLCIVMPPLVTGAIASVSIAQTQVQTQDSESLEQQGRAAYETGDYSAAVEAFQRAASDYAAQGQPWQQAIALANLSLSYQQLGQWSEAAAAIESALELVPAVVDAPPALWASRGKVLSVQGQLLDAQGNTSEAERVWIDAATAYDKAGQPRQKVQVQLNQARMLLTAGFYSRALTLVETALTEQPNDAVTVDALRLHGDLLRLTGDREKAAEQLDQALKLAQTADPTAVSQIHISLGTLAEANNNQDVALENYRLAAATSDSQPRLSAQVNQLQLLVNQEDWAAIASLLPPLMDQLQAQPPNRETIYTRITVGQTLLNLRQAVDDALDKVPPAAAPPSTVPDDSVSTTEVPDDAVPVAVVPAATVDDLLILVNELPSGDAIATLLLETYAAAQQLGDVRAQTYALSTLGQLYMQTQQWKVAKQQTLTALSLAQGAGLVEIEYQLQAQLCQILQNPDAAGSGDEAISACRAAVDNANLLREDLAAKGSDASFN
ncbi:tetratricopeptide repeat protein, partial [Leptolyngbya cf. ectocarpi LEGE 11479]